METLPSYGYVVIAIVTSESCLVVVSIMCREMCIYRGVWLIVHIWYSSSFSLSLSCCSCHIVILSETWQITNFLDVDDEEYFVRKEIRSRIRSIIIDSKAWHERAFTFTHIYIICTFVVLCFVW